MDPYLHAHREEEPQQSPAAVSKRPTEPLISIIGASLGTTPRSVSAAVAAAPRTASAAHGGSAAARPLATAQPPHHQAAAPIANAAATILGTTTKTSASNARPPLQLPSRQQGQSTASSVLHSIDPKSVDSKSLDVKSHGGPKRSPRRSPRRQSPAVSIAKSTVTPNTGRSGQDAHRPPSHEDARRGGSGSVSAAVAAALGPHLTGKSAPSGIATANDAASKRGPHATARTPSDLPTTISDSIIPERSETKPNATLHRGGAQHGGHLPPRGIDAGLLGSSRTGIAGVSATPTGSATPGLLDNIGAPSLRTSNASAQPNRAPYLANFSRLLADNSVAGESGATRALHHRSNQGDMKGQGGGEISGRDESSVRREIPTHPSADDVPPQHRDQLLQFEQHGDIGHLGAGLVSSAHREASVNGNVGFLESSAAARGQVPPRKATHSASMVDTTLNEINDAGTRVEVAGDQGIAGEEDQVSAFDRLKTLRIHAARDKEVLLGRIEELSTALMQSQHRANLSDEEVKSYHEHFGSLDDFAARQVVQQEELLAAKKKLRAAIERANEAEAEADDLRRGIAAERAHIARHHYNIQTNQVLPAQIHQARVNASRGPSAASGLISTSGQGGARDPSPTSAQQSQSASQHPLDGQTGGAGSGVGGVMTAPVFGAPDQFAASSTVPLIVIDPHAKLAHLESRLATALAESSLLQDEAASVCRTFAAKRAHIAASRKQKRLRDATEKLRGIAKKAAEMEANSTSLNNNGNGDDVDGDGGGVRPETLPYRMTKEAIAAEIAQEDRRREDEDAFIDHETERALWQERGQLAEIDRLLSQKATLVEQLDAAVDAARAELQHRQDDPQHSFPHTATMPQIAALLDAAPTASRGGSNHPLITPGAQAGVTDDASRGVSAAAGAPVATASGLPSHSQSPALGAEPSVSGDDVVSGSAPIVDPSNQGSVHAASQQSSHVPSQSQSVQPNDPSRHGSVGGGSHAGGDPSAAGSVVGGASADAGGGLGQNDGAGLVASAAQSTTSQPAVPIAITRAELEHKMVHALASKEWMKLVNVGTYEVSYKNNTTGKIVPDLAREMAEELRREHAARHRAQLAADGDAVAAAAAAVSSPSVPHAGNSSLAQGVHGDGRSLSTALVPSPQQRRDGSTGSGSNALVASNNNLGPAGGEGRGVDGGLSNSALIDSNNEIAAAAAELRAQRDQSLAAVRLAEAATHTALSQVRSLAEKNKALKDENETVRKLLLRVAKAGLIGAPTRASTQEAAAAAAATEAATKANVAAAAAAASTRGLSSSDPPPPGGDDDGPPPSSDPSGEGAASGEAEKDGDGKPPVDPEMERLKSEVTVPLRMPGLPRLTPPELPATLDRERLAERAGRLEEDNDALRHRVVELSVEAAKKEDRLQALEETIRKLMPE